MGSPSVLLYLTAIVVVAYSQTTTQFPSNIGIGTKHCKLCGEFSDNINVKEGPLTPSDISQCTLVNSADTIEESTFQCECRAPHFVGDGLTCNNFNECANSTDNCDNNAKCTDTESSFTCDCIEGYEGDGVTCKDFNECGNQTYVAAHNHTHDPCDRKGECFNTVGSYYCVCREGLYEQVEGTNRTECVDINECLDSSLHDCSGQSVCVNDVPSFHCECNIGYKEGTNSTGQGFDCQNINECTDKPNACGSNSTCTDGVGSYSCACDKGFTWKDPSNRFGDCRDIDECTEIGDIDCSTVGKFKVCKNTISAYECVCGEGYTDVNGTCQNDNECKHSPCDANANCTDTSGSYSCLCRTGWLGDGFKCRDINECEAGGDECDRTLARCSNGQGSYTCQCIYGYTGDGRHGNCKVTGGDLQDKGDRLSRVQSLIKVHSLENQRQQLENEHEILLRRCDKQDQKNNRIIRERRAILDVTKEEAANAQLWIVTLQSHVSNLQLQNHALALACPEE